LQQTAEDDLCLVALCATEGIGPSTIAALADAAGVRRLPLADALAADPEGLARDAGLRPAAAQAVASLPDPVDTGRILVDRLRRMAIRPVLRGAAGYPASLVVHLGDQAPPAIFVAGEASLLDRRCLAIVGSRRPSRAAARAARDLAVALGERAVVVSGGARGTDLTAHKAAAAAGGTICVPATGLVGFRRSEVERWNVAEPRWCGLGQFPPQAGWQAAFALIRNRTIVAMAEAVIAFEPRDTGGTWHSSLNALQMRKPLFIVSGARRGARGRGLQRLVRLGAVAVDPHVMPDPAEMDRLIAEYAPPQAVDQLPLFRTPKI
jgi:DNA processing protein